MFSSNRRVALIDDIESLFYDQIDINDQMSSRPADAIVIEGYATRWGVRDLEGEEIRAGAFTRSLALSQGAHGLFMHGQREDGGHDDNGWPIGKWTTVKVDRTGLWVRGSLYPKRQTPWGASPELMQLVRDKLVNELSIGFYPLAVNRGLGGRSVTEGWLTEISVGRNPVLPGSTFSIVNR